MPTYFLEIKNFEISSCLEYKIGDNSHRTVIEIDGYGTGIMEIRADNDERAMYLAGQHLELIKNWKN